MKRTLENINGDIPDDAADDKDRMAKGTDHEDHSPISTYLLVNRNKGLFLELMNCKRSLTEARKELDLMRRKSREMESLVSLVQRAWSQLDIDASLILDSLGDMEVHIPEQGSSELLFRLLHASNRFMLMDPTSLENTSKVETDQWSSKVDIAKAKEKAEKKEEEYLSATLVKSEKKPDAPQEVVDISKVFGDQMEKHLESHVSFTTSILERLCSVINELADLQDRQDILNALSKAKENYSVIMLLNDGIVKLRSEIIEMQARVQIAENEKIRAEKKLDKALFTIKDLEEHGAMRKASGGNGEGHEAAEAGIESSPSAGSFEKELQRQVQLLEQQLADSESAKAKVEMQMTEKLAKPLAQTETYVSDMRKIMEELKMQFKQRLGECMKQIESLQNEKKDLESAMGTLEKSSASKVERVMQEAEKEIAKVKLEKEKIEQMLSAVRADSQIVDQLRVQSSELQAFEDARNSRIRTLENDIKILQESMTQIQRSLDKSRKREKYLEQTIITHSISVPSHVKAEFSTKSEDIMTDELEADTSQQLIKQLQDRCIDLEKELSISKSSINDLILEIEAVAGEESKSRGQSERLARQITEYQSTQRAALEENLCLHNQLEELKDSKKEMEMKTDLIKNVMMQQDSLLSQVRAEEYNLRAELSAAKKELRETLEQKVQQELKAKDLEEKMMEKDHKLQAALKRNQDLQTRCDELTKQCEQERKRRFEELREATKKDRQLQKDASSSGSAATGGKGSEQDMLDMTLGMLRCSVCKDRFKSVAITRCFHLFCKECVDESLRNRSRKCPACGEKFGQDDVSTVYFTH